MKRRYLIAGNWKLNKTVPESLELIRELKRLVGSVRHCDIAVAPTYVSLWPVAEKLKEGGIQCAGQDLYYEDHGAFTGAVSGTQLKEAGCSMVLVGHSERRQFFGETLESSRLRMLAALRAGLIPILCVGETLNERSQNLTNKVIGEQLDAVLLEVDVQALQDMVIAYEPVWAIGTGNVATPQQAQEVHRMIRERLRAYSTQLSESTRILYGGSVKPDNAGELLNQVDIDGALVGGASLKADSFAAIVKSCPSHGPG